MYKVSGVSAAAGQKAAGQIEKETNEHRTFNLFTVSDRLSFIRAPPLAASDQSDRKEN
jgi:hypothetical protein